MGKSSYEYYHGDPRKGVDPFSQIPLPAPRPEIKNR